MKKLTNEEFIEKAKSVHGDLYGYSLVEFVGVNFKVRLICSKHGEFKQRASAHLLGQTCMKCESDRRKIGLTEFLNRCKKKHSDKYDYSLVTEYKPNREYVDIICKEHGIFKTTTYHHSI